MPSFNYTNMSAGQWYMLSIIPKLVTVATRERHILISTGKPRNTKVRR